MTSELGDLRGRSDMSTALKDVVTCSPFPTTTTMSSAAGNRWLVSSNGFHL